MSLWWLQPGWTDAVCQCGKNIWKSGGDPDMGECPECFYARHTYQREPEPRQMCDICGKYEAVAGSNGFGVCSQECSDEAQRRQPVTGGDHADQ